MPSPPIGAERIFLTNWSAISNGDTRMADTCTLIRKHGRQKHWVLVLQKPLFGASVHWIKDWRSKIANYQLVVPTTWMPHRGIPKDESAYESSIDWCTLAAETSPGIIRTIHMPTHAWHAACICDEEGTTVSRVNVVGDCPQNVKQWQKSAWGTPALNRIYVWELPVWGYTTDQRTGFALYW